MSDRDYDGAIATLRILAMETRLEEINHKLKGNCLTSNMRHDLEVQRDLLKELSGGEA